MMESSSVVLVKVAERDVYIKADAHSVLLFLMFVGLSALTRGLVVVSDLSNFLQQLIRK